MTTTGPSTDQRPYYLHILPRRQRKPDGIGDYATLLAAALLSNYGIASRFLSATPTAAANYREDGWPTLAIAARSASTFDTAAARLEAQGQPMAAVVHVSLYGYQQRALPFWLLAALRRWKLSHSSTPLIGIFHELWASGSPWKSSFWLGPLQRRIVSEIARLADANLTTTDAFQQRLAALSRPNRCAPRVMNVFSNIGEPERVQPIRQRRSRLAVFSGAGLSHILIKTPQALKRIIIDAGIDGIDDIGARPNDGPADAFGRPVLYHGVLDAGRVSALLATARIGLLPYANRDVLGKSTVLAAYASHGVVPIAIAPYGPEMAGFQTGEHYLTDTDAHASAERLQRIQDRNRVWYAGHTTERHADALVAATSQAALHR